MRLERLVRYPIKGLRPDYLQAVDVESGGPIPFDREYAIAHGATEFDSQEPEYLQKHHFLMLMRDPPLAALETTYDERARRITVAFPDGPAISGCLDDAEDRRRLEAALSDFVGDRSRGGPPRIVSAENHRFFDVPEDYLSLINLASVAELGDVLNLRLDPIRFRANLYVTGLGAWEETRLVGRDFNCGDVRLRAAAAIERCKATCVNPDTAEVDVNVPFSLRKHFDTLNMGLYLTVVEGGRLEAGAEITLA